MDAAWRAQLIYFTDDPAKGASARVHHRDGLLVVRDGTIAAVGAYADLIDDLPPEIPVHDHRDCLLSPGFIDTHVHYPQTEMIGAWGEQLLSWLNTYTFPTELQFKDKAYARKVADIFLSELLRNGTTTALVFCTVHPESVDAFFEASQARGLRMIGGKVLMDRHAPEGLLDTAETGIAESRELIERWHGVDRLLYAITPRFAPTSSDEQLLLAGELLAEHPGVYMHTHLSENPDEIAWVGDLFPTADDYLDVYDRAKLLGKRSVFAHGVHLDPHACERIAKADAAIAHCPTSNAFLGSGLLPLAAMDAAGVKVGLGTDIGAGTTFSLLQTMGEAYKIQQLRGEALAPSRAWYFATLGGARALDLEGTIGSLAPGNEADFVLIDPTATPLLSFRTAHCKDLDELIFALMILGDDRAIKATYSAGRRVHRR